MNQGMTKTQREAAAKVRADGTVHAYNGITLATARVLADMGIVTLNNYGTRPRTDKHGRRSLVRNWSITIVPKA